MPHNEAFAEYLGEESEIASFRLPNCAEMVERDGLRGGEINGGFIAMNRVPCFHQYQTLCCD